MIGVSWQIEEPMEIGKLNGRSLYVDGAEGIGALAESFGKQHDMQVHVILRAALYNFQLWSFGREKMKFLKLSQMNGLHE